MAVKSFSARGVEQARVVQQQEKEDFYLYSFQVSESKMHELSGLCKKRRYVDVDGKEKRYNLAVLMRELVDEKIKEWS